MDMGASSAPRSARNRWKMIVSNGAALRGISQSRRRGGVDCYIVSQGWLATTFKPLDHFFLPCSHFKQAQVVVGIPGEPACPIILPIPS
jgi:hypothetical protein